MYLAQLNIAASRFDLDDPRMADFVANLDRINAAAEAMPGFIWRFKDDSGTSVDAETPWDDNVIVNMGVWETPEHLEQFTWNTVHKRFYSRKTEWFEAMKSHHFVMWWVEEGHEPTLEEAKARLDHLDQHGNSDHAFGWSHLPQVKLWQQQRCG